MRLKQIKLAGFKSFVDPTVVSFPSSGRCAVVGPNGCGKSNIIDAVRWVMGESSARHLRGEVLTDVIFNGSQGRKLAGMASVELLFDNSFGRIGGEYASYGEIAVRREVSREARSLYFLNGVACRRRDIADVFFGTGIGPRSYSIIEQGMISSLVESRPDELRAHLEEAAGISKYKERRRETENRIKHTEENLGRLTDIRDELAQQLERLQRQAKAAERYQNLKVEQKRIHGELDALRLIRLVGELEKLQQSLTERDIAFAGKQARLRRLEAETEAARASREEVGDAATEVQGHYYRLGGDIARDEEAIQFHRKRLQDLEAEAGEVERHAEQVALQLALDEAKVEDLQGKIDGLAPAAKLAQAEDARAAAALSAFETDYQSREADWEAFNRQVAADDREAGILSSRRSHLQQSIERLRARLLRLGDQGWAPAETDDGDMNGIALEIQALEAQSAKLQGELDLCMDQIGLEQEHLVAKEADFDQARIDVQRLRHELARLQASQQLALGRSNEAVQSWLEGQGLDAVPRLGELLSVAPGWEHAMEMVLGDFVQALRVEDLNAYTGQVGDLIDGRLGLVEGRVDAEASGELPSLASLLRPSDLKLGSLLYGVFAAESDEVALAKRSQLKPGESIVTRTGLWLGRDWLRHRPKIDEDVGIIERTQDLETQEGRVLEAEQSFGDQQQVAECRERIRVLEDQRELLRGGLYETLERVGKLKADYGVRQVKLEEARAQRTRLVEERRDLMHQIEQEQERLAQAEASADAVEDARSGETEERQRLMAVKERLLEALAAARPKARARHDHYHAIRMEQQALVTSLQAVEAARQRLAARAAEFVERSRRIEQSQKSSQAPLPELKRNLEAGIKQRAAIEAELGELRRRSGELDAQLRRLGSDRAAAEEEVEQVRGQLGTLREDRAALQVQKSHLNEQIAASGFTLEALVEALPENAAAADWTEKLAGIDRRIQRLGAINLTAIDELRSQSERKAHLDAQHEDVTKALETLLRAIHKIDRETRARFKETFDQINVHLGELFPQVFGGGRAYLEMTGTDLLSTGVSLMARPPGKRNASVNLLSGGEKAMTAIALIFSIFQLNPSPVCLLDEVDAPLDDANVGRFAELIEKMSQEVQFVMVTHNKLTMEMADHLMGVTMSEPGVSRVVSVDVEKAAAMAAA